jgi:hypothetical protein
MCFQEACHSNCSNCKNRSEQLDFTVAVYWEFLGFLEVLVIDIALFLETIIVPSPIKYVVNPIKYVVNAQQEGNMAIICPRPEGAA